MTNKADQNRSDGMLSSAAGHVSEAAHVARDKAGEAVETIRERAVDAYEAAREKASTAREATSSTIETSPLGVVAGGIALGAVLGALLPRSEKEAQLLRPVADKATTAAKMAFTAAREAGQSKLDELGINREAARAKVDQLVDSAAQAASSAGSAAKDAVRGRSEA